MRRLAIFSCLLIFILVNVVLAGRPSRRSRTKFTLVGALQLAPFNKGVHADVAGYKNLAFVGKWRGPCPGTGVDIIDISNPTAPVKLADTTDYPDTSMEDMKAIRIGDRDVLAIGLQDCGQNAAPEIGKRGLELIDITNPAAPTRLSFLNVSPDHSALPSTEAVVGPEINPRHDEEHASVGGVHELDVTTTPSGRVLALLAVPGLEQGTYKPPAPSQGDLLIVDITEPTKPALVGEWGVLDEPAYGLAFFQRVRQGGDARTLLHSVRANSDGTRAYLSYWDAGVIILDIADPTRPRLLGRTSYMAGEEGNAHSVAEARNGTLLIQADEDFSPFGLGPASNGLSSAAAWFESAVGGARAAHSPGATPPPAPGQIFNGWGFVRVFDLTDPTDPIQLSNYATPNSKNEAVTFQGWWSVHNPEVVGNVLFASWYNDGVRAIDITDPTKPKELGFWRGTGAPAGAPPVNIWSAVPHGKNLLVSDLNFGLYILRFNPR